MAETIPTGITKEHIEQAIKDFDAQGAPGFGGSTFYDLVHENRRYPPKAILALAAKRAADADLKPTDFTGGVRSKCFRTLEGAGFQIVRKQR